MKLPALIVLATLAAMPARADDLHPIVVELFTSQGCASCPPADEALAMLATRSDVVAVSFNLDIWDYIGWQDTLALPGNTERQRAYAQRLKTQVYTPQVIVDGSYDIVGSRSGEIDAAIERRKAESRNRPVVSLALNGDNIVVDIGPDPSGARNREAKVWLLRTLASAAVEVEAGENSGNTLVYTNVVRARLDLGPWNGNAITLAAPRRDPNAPQADGFAVIVQEKDQGEILGASLVSEAALAAQN